MNPPPYSQAPGAQPVTLIAPNPQQPTGVNPNGGQAYIVNAPPQQLGYANGCVQIFYTCSPAPVIYNNYKSRQAKFLGIFQIIIGILCIAFNGAAIGVANYYDYLSVASVGIWGGVFFIITGAFGIPAAKYKSRGFVITFMVLSLIALSGAAVLLILSCINVALFASECSYNTYYSGYNYNRGYYYSPSYYWWCPEQHASRLAMNSILLILAVIEGLLCIWSSVIGCKVACCCAKPNPTAYTIQPQPVMFSPMNGNQQIVVLSAAPNAMPVPQSPTTLGYPVMYAPPFQQTPPVSTGEVNPGFVNTTEEKSGDLA